MNTTVDLPADLVHEIERRAAGRNLNEAMTDLLRKGLQASEADVSLPRPAVKLHSKTGLPYIECPRAADDLTPRRVADLLLDQEVTWHHETR